MAEVTPRLTQDEAKQRVALWLQEQPLYARLDLSVEPGVTQGEPSEVMPGAIQRPCRECRDHETTSWATVSRGTAFHHAYRYQCVLCRKDYVEFWLEVTLGDRTEGPRVVTYGQVSLRKVGQSPPWSTKVPRAVENALEDSARDLYRKGLTCVSQSYGVGALAYFRRLVEETTVSLLDLIKSAAEAEGDAATAQKIEDVKAGRNADEKLRLAAGLVPQSLRPGGVNPLAVLFDHYSRGLHALPDAECLEIASDLRADFEYVFKNLRTQAEEAREYAKRIRRRTQTKG